MAAIGQVEHLADRISERRARECGNAFNEGHVLQVDETTFGVRIGNTEYRGDGIVEDTMSESRDFNSIRWQKNDGEDFEIPK
jgi:hypothetical protein